MKHLFLFMTICILLFSSCSNNQNIEEDRIFALFGDSCVNRITKKSFYPHPPPSPDIILRFFDDTIKAKLELNRLDTLGYPFRFSVCNFKAKNDSSVSEYYKAFSQQNELRLKYIYENIIINDSLRVPSSVLLAEAVEYNDALIKEFSHDNFGSMRQKLFKNKPLGKSWNKEKLNDNSKLIDDLRPINIKFYRVVFNKTKTKGILIYYFNVWGYTDGFACIDLENIESNWAFKGYHWFSVNLNEKRWKIK